MFCHVIRRQTCTLASVVGIASTAASICRNAQYSSSGRKNPSLPNNRTNEMIRGCETRSILGHRPPPRPFHDDPVEHRLIVHGFSRRRREGARRPCRALQNLLAASL